MNKILAISLLIVAGCNQGNEDSSSIWASFVASPSPQNEQLLMAEIEEELEECGWGKSENQNAVPDRFRQDLFELISDGDSPSYRVGLRIEKCLDGGDLGDFRRSTGLFFDTNPDAFLEESKSQDVSPERFAELITSLPLALADDPISQRNLVIERIGKLERPQVSAESQLIGNALTALREREQLLSYVVEEQE